MTVGPILSESFPIADELRYWAEHFEEEVDKGKTWTERLGILVCRSKVSACMLVVLYIIDLVDLVQAPDFLSALPPLRLMLGCHSTLFATLLFILQRPQAREVLATLLKVAQGLEQDAQRDPAVKEALRRRSTRARIMKHLLHAYGLGALSFGVYSLFGDIRSSTWARKLLHPSWMQVLLLYEALTYAFAIFTYMRSVAFLNATYLCASGMFDAVGIVFADEAHRCSERSLSQLCRLHGALVWSMQQMDEVMRALYMHLMATMVVLPALCTVELVILGGGVDMMSLGTLPAINLFFTLTLASQELLDASDDIGWKCYEGTWPEESASARRLRCLSITMATRPSTVMVRGLGTLSREAGLEVVKRWFSFIQVLMNLL